MAASACAVNVLRRPRQRHTARAGCGHALQEEPLDERRDVCAHGHPGVRGRKVDGARGEREVARIEGSRVDQERACRIRKRVREPARLCLYVAEDRAGQPRTDRGGARVHEGVLGARLGAVEHNPARTISTRATRGHGGAHPFIAAPLSSPSCTLFGRTVYLVLSVTAITSPVFAVKFACTLNTSIVGAHRTAVPVGPFAPSPKNQNTTGCKVVFVGACAWPAKAPAAQLASGATPYCCVADVGSKVTEPLQAPPPAVLEPNPSGATTAIVAFGALGVCEIVAVTATAQFGCVYTAVVSTDTFEVTV
jgi:hypothetical protein